MCIFNIKKQNKNKTTMVPTRLRNKKKIWTPFHDYLYDLAPVNLSNLIVGNSRPYPLAHYASMTWAFL